MVHDRDRRPVILAHASWDISRALEKHEQLVLSETPDPTLFEKSG